MSKVASIKWLQKTLKHQNRALLEVNRHCQRWRIQPVLASRAKYTHYIQTENWNALMKHALKEVTEHENALDELLEDQRTLYDLRRTLDVPLSVRKNLPEAVTQIPIWNKWKNQLLRQLKECRLDLTRARTAIKWLENTNGPSLLSEMTERVGKHMLNADANFSICLSRLAAGWLAWTVARFNQVVKETIPPMTNFSETWLKTIEHEIQDLERAIWKDLRREDYKGVIHSATALRLLSEHNLVRAADETALLLQKRRSNGAPSSINVASLRMSNLIHSLIQAVVLGYYAQWLAKWEGYSSETQIWVKASSQLTFSHQSTHRCITVDTFTHQRKSRPGPVCLVGTIKSVTIKHRGKKAVSSAEIVGEKGATIKIALPYIKLDSSGIVPGAFVRVNGEYSSKIEWLDGDNAVIIARKNYTELKKKSWFDWMTSELRGVFDPVANGLSAEFSWEPGLNGAGNPLRFGVWYLNASRKGGQHADTELF